MRYLFYSHDTYGLGHLRRSLRIADAVRSRDRAASILILTGCPAPHVFRMPEGVDVVRLPAVTKRPSGEYAAKTLGLPLSEMTRIRSALIRVTLDEFAPHVFLIDHAPSGVANELRSALVQGRGRPHVVLGLRDIIDDAACVDETWERDGTWTVLNRYYDDIVVYGDPSVETTAQELRLDERCTTSVSHVGYVAGTSRRSPARRPGLPRLVVTAGGGGDGAPMMKRFLSYLEAARPKIETTVVAGPLMPASDAAAITESAARVRGTVVLRSVPRLDALIAQADGVVAMAGYNTTAELLATGTPALLFPRRAPRREQWIRAQRLQHRADLTVYTPETVSNEDLDEWVEGCGRRTIRSASPLMIDGASTAAQRLTEAAARRAVTVSA